MRLLTIILLLTGVFCPVSAIRGETILSKARPVFLVESDEVSQHRFKLNEVVCVKQTQTSIACGKVRSASVLSVTIELLKTFPIHRFSSQLKTLFHFELGQEIKAHSLLEVRAPTEISRKRLAPNSSHSSASQRSNTKLKNKKEPLMLFAVGIDYLFPFLKYQFLISPKISGGVLTSILNNPLPNGTSFNAYSALLTFNYYEDGHFAGLWAEMGAGTILSNVRSGETTQIKPSVMAHLGYRWRWKSGPTFGFAAGAQYIFKETEFSGLLPSISVDFGFAF